MSSADPRPDPPASPPAPPHVWWPHLAVLGWAAVLLVALEVVAEVRAHRRGWDTLLFGQAPVETAAGAREFGPTGAHPFRSRIVPVEKPAGALRVWIASASYALGGNLPARQVFPVVLEDRLRARGTPTQVLNAGRIGVTTPDNVRELEVDGPRWKPDVVVLYQMSTDIDELTRLLLSKAGLAAAAGAEGLDWGSWLADRTTLYPLLKENASSRITLLRPLADTLGAAGGKAFEARVRAFLASVRALGARPVLCTFATSHDRANPDPLPLHVFRFNIRLSRRGWHDTVDAWNEVLRRVAREEGVPLVDVAASLLGKTGSFVDFVHLAPAGHETVARLLEDAVSAEGVPR